LEGRIRVNSRFFEDGNVELKDILNVKNPITFTGSEDKIKEVKEIMKVIERYETKS
jgi:hypothetical protein